MGWWTLRNCWLIKSSYKAQNELQACQLTETNVQKNPQNSTTCQNLLKTDKVKKNVDINNWNIFPGYKKKIRKVKD